MTYRSADVVVIGGGVNGTSIAMHLSRMGVGKVLLVEKGGLASGASGRSGAMVREHYLHPTLVKMAMEASEIFHNFRDAVGGDARFVETGRLLLFGGRDEAAARANVEMNRTLGVEIYCLSPSEILETVPHISTDGVVLGVYEPNSGYADPMATTYAYAEQAKNGGAEILTGCAVNKHQDQRRAGRWRGDRPRTDRDGGCCDGDGTLGQQVGRASGRDFPYHPHQGADGASAASAVTGVADDKRN